MKPLLLLTAMTALAAPPIQVHGHRGARAVRPENTLPAFEYAIGLGVDVLELDMAVTKDDVVVISHDPIVNAEICQGPGAGKPLRSLTFAEVRQIDCGSLRNPHFAQQQPVPGTRIPTLDEVFALAKKGAFHFNIETKIFAGKPDLAPAPGKFAQLVLDIVRKHKLESRVILQSFDFRTLHAMKKLEPRIRLSALDERGKLDFVALARESGASIVSPHYSLVTPEKVKAAHAAGLQVVPWTANERKDWEKLVAAEVDAIISDDPASLIAFLREKGLR